MSEFRQFNAVYTADKHKKQNKRWLEGSVKYCPDTSKFNLYNDSKKLLTSYTLKPGEAAQEGDELDVGMYIVVVNEPLGDPDCRSRDDEAASVSLKAPTQIGLRIDKKIRRPRLLHKVAKRDAIAVMNNRPRSNARVLKDEGATTGTSPTRLDAESSAGASDCDGVEFSALYTTQKTKKLKSWIEGSAYYYRDGHRLILFNDEKQIVSKSRLKPDQTVKDGETLDCGMYLIQLEAIDAGITVHTAANAPRKGTKRKQAAKLLDQTGAGTGRGMKRAVAGQTPATTSSGTGAAAPPSSQSSLVAGSGETSIMSDVNKVAKPTQGFKSPVVAIPKHLHFSSRGELECIAYQSGKFQKEPMRVLIAPTEFQSWDHYRTAYSALLREHLQIQLVRAALCYHRLIRSDGGSSRGEVAAKMVPRFGKRAGARIDVATGVGGSEELEMERRSKALGMGYYSECTLRPSWSSPEESGALVAGISTSTNIFGSMFLEINYREHYSRYSKDDLWAISADSRFGHNGTFLGRSLYYGPSKENSLELQLVSEHDAKVAKQILSSESGECCEGRAVRGQGRRRHFFGRDSVQVKAVRCLPSGNDWTMIDLIESLGDTDTVPVLDFLLSSTVTARLIRDVNEYNSYFEAHYKPGSHPLGASPADVLAKVAKIAQIYIERYRLNSEQARILESIVLSVAGHYLDVHSSVKVNPITLVHGPFGTGKSMLIAVLVICLDEIVSIFSNVFGWGQTSRDPDEDGSHNEGEDEGGNDGASERFHLPGARGLPRLRVLVTSMTNVAVDNVLQALLKLGYDGFRRVGSLKRIAKPIFPYVARSVQSSAEDIKELEEMLETTNDEAERESIAQKICQIRDDQSSSECDQLDDVFVVGCTCLASTLSVIRDQAFPLIIADEACQVPEPMLMVPILGFQCRQLVLIGDPLQLPPTMTTLAAKKAEGKGLDRTLFHRLNEMGYKPLPLRMQYRCHPHIAQICNQLFYSNTLRNGVGEDDRPPLLASVPPMLFLETLGKEAQQGKSMSYFNRAELDAGVAIVRSLLNIGIDRSQIGVIALYKTQAEMLNERINVSSNSQHRVQVSTVDAFQGSEKDIIILSCVKTANLGFVTNAQRINVALSRSRYHCIILGYPGLLCTNDMWRRIMDHCKSVSGGYQPCQAFVQRLVLSATEASSSYGEDLLTESRTPNGVGQESQYGMCAGDMEHDGWRPTNSPLRDDSSSDSDGKLVESGGSEPRAHIADWLRRIRSLRSANEGFDTGDHGKHRSDSAAGGPSTTTVTTDSDHEASVKGVEETDGKNVSQRVPIDEDVEPKDANAVDVADFEFLEVDVDDLY